MPYLHLKTSEKLNGAQVDTLRAEIAAIMDILPGKTRNNTMIQIEGGANLFMGDGNLPCAFIDLRMFKASPTDAKERFVKALTEILKTQLYLEPGRIYMNLIELETWASNGQYNT